MMSLHFRPLQPGRFFSVFLCCVLISVSLSHLHADDLRIRQRMDDNWKFLLGDAPDFSRSDFNDSAWRDVTLPHDWSIEQKIDPAAPTGGPGGYYPTGVGWYREVINAPADWKGKQVQVEFEGVYMDADVFLNGQKLFTHPYGYTSFFVDLTPLKKVDFEDIGPDQ